jgi:hypothetical protein
MSAIEKLAAIISEHDDRVVKRGINYCACGMEVRNAKGFHAHVAEVIAGSDDITVVAGEPEWVEWSARTVAEHSGVLNPEALTLVELEMLKPKGSFGSSVWAEAFGGDRRCGDQFDSYAHVEVDSEGLIDVDVDIENGLFSDEATRLAAAILSAARQSALTQATRDSAGEVFGDAS